MCKYNYQSAWPKQNYKKWCIKNYIFAGQPPLAVVQKTKLSAQRCIFCSHGTHCCPVLFTINKITRFPQLKPSEAQSNFILNQTHRDETKSESSWNSAFAFENTG